MASTVRFVELSEMDYQVSRAEVRKLSREFRVVASQLLRTAHEDGINNLQRLIKFIETNHLIYDFVLKNQKTEYEIPVLISQLKNTCNRYKIPDNKEEEISYTYQLLKYGLANFSEYYYFPMSVGGYNGNKIQTKVDEFNKTIVFSFVNQIDGFLTNLLIDLGDDDQNTIHVQVGNLYGAIMSQERSIRQSNDFRNATLGGGVAGGDINGAVINTISQYTDASRDETLKLIEVLRQELPNLAPDHQDVAIESLAALEEEVATPTKLSRFKTLLFALWSAGKDVVTFANTLTALADRLGIQLPRRN